ncbi:hypothetical protein L204_102922 [Cryptococcus depauperatus]
MSYLSFQELEALTQLANRGGIGTATALEDCIAKEPSQLMYCKNDHLIILKDLGDVLMASCEHVVGWVKRENLVQLTIAGTSSESKSSSPQIWDGNTERNIIKTTLTAPSPPPSGKTLQSAHHSIIQSPLQHPSAHSTFQGSQSGSKRISGPFELDSGIEPSHSGPGLPTYSHENKEGEVFLLPPRPPKSLHRQPSTSIETNHSFNLKARNQQPVDAPESGNEADGIVKSSMAHQTFEGSATLDHANPAPEAVTTPTSTTFIHSHQSPTLSIPSQHLQDEGCDSDHSWDIFGDYARESMYLPVQAHLSTTSTGTGSGTKTSSRRKPSQSTLELSEIRRPRASSDGRKTKDEHIASTDFKQEPQSDTNPSFKQYDTPSHYSGDDLNIPQDITTPKASIYPTPITPEFSDIHIDSKKLQLNPTADQSDSDSPKADSSILSLPQLSGHGEKDKYIIKQSEKEKENGTERSDSPPLLSHSLKLQPISRSLPLECPSQTDTAPDSRQEQEQEQRNFQNSIFAECDVLLGSNTQSASFNVLAPFSSAGTSTNDDISMQGSQQSMDKQSLLASPLPKEEQKSQSHRATYISDKSHFEQPHSEHTALRLDGRSDHSSESTHQHILVSAPHHSNFSSSMTSTSAPTCHSSHPYSPPSSQGQSHSPNACLSLSPKSSPSFPSSPSLWSPDSPASPHSIAATRQAVEARNRHRQIKRERQLDANSQMRGADPKDKNGVVTERLKIATTLVGRMEDDLRGAKGPVPIRFLVNGEGLPTLEPTAVPEFPPASQSAPGFDTECQSDEQKQESKVIEVRMPSRIEQNGLPSPLVSRESVSRSNTQNSMRNTVYPLLSIPKRSVTAPPPSLSSSISSAGPGRSEGEYFPASQSSRTLQASVQSTSSSTDQSASSFTLNSGSNAQRQVLVSSNRPRSRSFSSSIARTLGVGRKASIPSALSLSVPGSSHGQEVGRELPSLTTSTHQDSPAFSPWLVSGIEQIPTSANNKRNNFFNSSLAPQSPARSPSRYLFNSNSPASASLPHTLSIANNSVNSLPVPASATSSTFGFTAAFSGKGSRSSKKGSRSIIFPSPVSHKDFKEETVKADGMDFELVQPSLRNNPSSPSYSQSPYSPSVHPNHLTSSVSLPVDHLSDHTAQVESLEDGKEEKGGRYEQDNAKTDQMLQSANPLATFGSGNHTNSTTGGVSLRLTVETDEWGFIKDKSPIPEIFSGKSEGGEVRQLEGRWLSIISTPLNGNPSKKVRKLVLESGVPNSLRGKVWAWFMAGTLSARVGGLYAELLGHDKGNEDERIDIDVVAAYSDHSIFAQTYSPGQQDLRSILRAYSNFAPAGYRSEMALIAGALLIHCVAEDSFWLLSGLVNTVLKDFYSKEQIGLKAVSEVFLRLLMKEEMKIGKLLKDVGIHPIVFLEKWFGQLFIRCLPWPTAMRVIDAVVCEGTRFLLVASLTILILSRDRLIRLPRKRDTILEYLFKLPQDSLLLPSHFMKACEAVKFDQKDYRNMKAAVEREMMIG